MDPITAIIASALVASVAMSFEIFGTATNIQWYSSAILFFVIFWHFPSEKVSPWIYVLAIIYGWTGIPSGILFPAFLVVGVVKQSRAHLIISAVLLIGVAIQVGCILNGPGVARHFEHRFSILVFPTVLHSILGLWITPSLASALGTKYLTLADGIAFLAISTLILSMPIKLASHARPLAMFALLVGFSASITQTFAGIGDADGFLKPVYGGRYYFISSSAIVLAFMFASKSHPKFVRIPLLLALTVNISAWYSQDWTVFTRGKAWEQVLDNCRQVTCTVPIWPEGWTVDIEK
ncbi:hypothetical protein [Rhizobium rhododendri]|uniref:Uncharacterized protein n=1 Tax=Rhizobium rhododendri TaxID=2506430 RepID=A0ABY8IPT6_9HYPH|nr:hypothetical protein [Rhizobium rhododendri]WFS25144.1 hypothetical protein PR018_23005 [Rhizobium rhododendri]